MTAYMTDTMRRTTDDGPGYSYGTMTYLGAQFHVRWGWLAYPIAVVLIAIIFVIVTIYKSRNEVPWKSSVMALMFHGFSDGDGNGMYQQVKDLDDPKEMIKATRKWSVALAEVDGTKRFVKIGIADEEKLSDERELAAHGAVRFGGASLQAFGQSGQ